MLSRKQEFIYSDSLIEAEKSNMLFKHGCIATYGGKIIAKGYNTHKYSTNDIFIENQCSCHAEMNVLRKIYNRRKYNKRKLDRTMKKTKLYISRLSKTGSNNSAPCKKCLDMIKYYNIKKIIFNMDNQYYEYNSKEYYTDHKTFGDYNLINKLLGMIIV